eukprot:COSAG02_NODE_41_length_47431_cov_32.449204_22_plen_551_part_00
MCAFSPTAKSHCHGPAGEATSAAPGVAPGAHEWKLTPVPRHPKTSDVSPSLCIFGSMRFPVPPEARRLFAALQPAGAYLKIVNMTAGQDIDKEVYRWIEHCETFFVFGTKDYGEDTGNSACTYNEVKFAQAKRKRIILLRMIPWEAEFEELQARVLFNRNMLTLEWQQGEPMPQGLVGDVLKAIGQPVARAHGSPAIDSGAAQALAGIEMARAKTKPNTSATVEQDQDGICGLRFKPPLEDVREAVMCKADSQIDWQKHLYQIGVRAIWIAKRESNSYELKVEVHRTSKLAIWISADSPNKTGPFSVECTDVSGIHTSDEHIEASSWPKLEVVRRDIDFDLDKQHAKRERPESVSAWLDRIGLGDGADKTLPPSEQLHYAQQLADQHYRDLGDLLAADETIVMGLLQQLTVPNILAGSVHPRAASFDVTESRSEPEPEPEPSVSYIQSPMPELHKTKFIGHWKASVAKNAKLEDECRTYGWPEADIIQAKSTRDPQALEKLLARAPQEVNEKERYLDSLLSVRYVEDKRAKKVMVGIQFEVQEIQKTRQV